MSSIDSKLQELHTIPGVEDLSQENAATCSGGALLRLFDWTGFGGQQDKYQFSGSRTGVVRRANIRGHFDNRAGSFYIAAPSNHKYRVRFFDNKGFTRPLGDYFVWGHQGKNLAFNDRDKASSFEIKRV
ncbi:MAG: hypothetical protein F6J89_26870 [Symploca sp. SIO1C4]|uniref:Uncharacterized protein n=1 Tax=Symploca sp. SIO1C4 TaxID=2607765 RepID=A0A6B3NJV6_9CYAN|nr:hypothetical protein [Symploca sp. SIO1C4]